MEKITITDLRALRRAIEGGASVEKVVWRQGSTPPPALWAWIKRYGWPFQQVPPAQLPPAATWCAYLSPVRLYTLMEWLAHPPQGVALALLGLTDPRNVGAILRSSAAFRVEWVLLRAEGTPLLSNDALWRASAGTIPFLRIVREMRLFAALKALKNHGWHLVAAVPPSSAACSYREWDWHTPTLLLLGSEEKGLPSEYLRLCEAQLTIPHAPQVESLNVSVATGILLAEAYVRQKERE
ncbi:MAG: RNA methyltransferase [Bacteroidia bacterium]|nr:RNA methyltransferase [Bacteroidia bacterium]GIV22518.1 MAG: hypothetical protein KatS3mg025_0177 [Bacteroidia bacterium]